MRRSALILIAFLILAVALTPAPAHAQDGRRYVVQPGDTLFSIAQRFGVSASELATINGLYDVNRVYIGQVLRLPNPIFQPQPQPVQPVQPVQPIQPVQPVQPIYPPGTTVTTVTTYVGYTVRKGDNLAAIAERFNTTIALILSANGISNANLIYVGQRLNIPRVRTTIVPRPSYQRPVTGRVYYVQPGDNLFAIAARFRRDVWAIARANGILNLNHIFIGQALIIP